MSEQIALPLPTDSRRDEMHHQFTEFHREHPEVWEMFVRFALDRIRRGYQNYGAQSIIERIRWETPIGDDGKLAFKINNNHTAFYARAFERAYPDHQGFFRKRTQVSDGQPATYLPPLGPGDFPEVNV